MTKDQVQAYVDSEVQKLSDAKIKPLIQSINSELAIQRDNNDRKAALDKANSESSTRITALQAEVGKAQTLVNDLATKLAEATTVAAE